MRVCWPGLIARLSVAPADAHELCVLPGLLESTRGLAVGELRNYRSPEKREELARSMGVALLAPYRSKKRDPAPRRRSALLSRLRYRIDTVFSQLTGRYSVKRVCGPKTFGTRPADRFERSSATPWPSCSTTGPATDLCDWLDSSTKTRTSG
jgi:hypothetical protein